MSQPIPSIELDKTFRHAITNYGFDNLENKDIKEILKMAVHSLI